MSIIELKEVNCKSCYKCIRNCDLKAISFKDDRARIVENDCILCGKCTLVCPQNAKQIQSDICKIQSAILDGKRVFASVAPSFTAAFPGVDFNMLAAALVKFGFCGAEETAIGAAAVSHEYIKLIEGGDMKNIITTCCPSVNLLVEKYYPSLKHYLAPVVAPATAHARMIKAKHNVDHVVFIGPCISKKYEAQSGNDIFAVLMFEELANLLCSASISLRTAMPIDYSMKEPVARLYPTPGGIIKTIPHDKRGKYRFVAIDGLANCIQMLRDLESSDLIDNFFIEMSSCTKSCVEGPGLYHMRTPYLLVNDEITKRAQQSGAPCDSSEGVGVNMHTGFDLVRIREHVPDEATIAAILASIGKTTEESMLNCSTCGYATCRDKAIAVFQGKADLNMCLPYMREKAESLSNLILQTTPNAIVLVDDSLNILQYNRAAREMYSINENEGVGFPATLYFDDEQLLQVQQTGLRTQDKRISLDGGARVVMQTNLPVANGDILIVAKDMTEQEVTYRRMDELRKQTLETTQKVIDKQMRAAQEIASLLGETAGESKAALIKLKRSFLEDERQ